MSVGSHAEKFNIIRKDRGHTHKCDSSVFDWKFLFRQIWSKKIRIVSLSENLIPRLIRIYRIQCSPLLGKLGPKNQNCRFKLQLCTYTNSNMQNSMVVFILFFLDRKYPFWTNLVHKIKIVSLS